MRPLRSGGIPDEVVPTRTPTPAWMERATPVNALNIFEEAAGPSGDLFEETAEFEIIRDLYDGVDLVVRAQPGCEGEEGIVRAHGRLTYRRPCWRQHAILLRYRTPIIA